MRLFVWSVLTMFALTMLAQQHSDAYRSMERKISHLQQNAAKTRPDAQPTEITDAEANAYFNEGGVKLPKGVSHFELKTQPAVIEGTAKVNFDEITQKARSTNPLLGVFSGIHDVRVIAQALGVNGTGTIKVQDVYLDGVEVPQMALEFFADRYIKPRYPNIGVTSTFKLPLRIDSAVVDSGGVRLVQK